MQQAGTQDMFSRVSADEHSVRRKIIYTYSTNFDEGLRVPALLNNASSSLFFIARLEKRENLLLKTKKKIVNFC